MGQRLSGIRRWCDMHLGTTTRTGMTVVCFPAPLKEKKRRAGVLTNLWRCLGCGRDWKMPSCCFTARSPQGRRTRSWSAQRARRAGTRRRRRERGCSPWQRLDHGYGWHIGKRFLVSMWLNHVTSECHSERNAEGAARRPVRLVVAFRKRWIGRMTHTHVTLHNKTKTTQIFQKDDE